MPLTPYIYYDSIRRIFSLSRSYRAVDLVVEHIPANGIIAEENEDIRRRYPDHANTGLTRLSFWKKTASSGLASLTNEDLLGYAILKQDVVPANGVNRKVDYVVEIFRPGVFYGGVQAEALALNILYSLLPRLAIDRNRWIKRLIKEANRGITLNSPLLVLRAAPCPLGSVL